MHIQHDNSQLRCTFNVITLSATPDLGTPNTEGTTLPWTTEATTSATAPTASTTQGPITTTDDDDGVDSEDDVEWGNCIANGAWAGDANMDAWCMSNCNHPIPNCPISHCICTD